MSDHDFEKQVRQTMEGFSVRPSKGSWETLEKTLNEKPRRRRGFLWIPVVLLLLISTAVISYEFIFNNDTGIHNQVADHNDLPASESLINQENSVPSPDQASPSNKNNSGTQNGISKADNDELNLTPDNIIENKVIEKPNASGRSLRIKKSFEDIHSSVPASREVVSSGNSDKLHQDNSISLTSSHDNKINPLPATRERKLRTAVLFERINFNHEFSIEEPKNTVKHDLIQKAISGNSVSIISRPWTFGLSFSTGISGINNGSILGLKAAEVADFSQTPNSPSLPWFGITYKPTDIEPGLTYSAGGYIRKELNRKLAVSAGLSFTSFSTKIQLGSRVDSSRLANLGSSGFLNLAYYYRPEQQRKYTMRYNYIELPVTMHYKFAQGTKIPLEISAGAILSRILNTTALHFDGSSGIYYENDAFVRQWQSSFHAGITAELFKRSSAPVKIGPAFRYSLSNLLTNDLPEINRFISVGIEAKISLKSFR